MNPLIDINELLALYDKEQFVLIDASSGKEAKSHYNKSHVEGALFVDLNTELSDIKADAADGGRHPLPALEDFLLTLNNLGIDNESHVVVYDNNYGANAATRFWWMLKAVGHEKVQVLNGGITALEKSGLPMSDDTVEPQKTKPYSANHWQLPLANLKEVAEHSEDKDYLVIDVREAQRYKGEFEPIDLVAGHIPGATNIPFSENLDENGYFLPREVLKEKYEEIFKQQKPANIIVHCGSGVTACHTLFALAYAGFEIPKLYVGSWSEWSRNNKRIVTEMDK